tara:strand:- start:1202 stop:1357 length:156 start_codon:yes stop_codon:yes gene_type:complete
MFASRLGEKVTPIPIVLNPFVFKLRVFKDELEIYEFPQNYKNNKIKLIIKL